MNTSPLPADSATGVELTPEAQLLYRWLAWYEPVIVVTPPILIGLSWYFPSPVLIAPAVALGLVIWPLTRYARSLVNRGKVDSGIIAIAVGIWLLALVFAPYGEPAFVLSALIAAGAVSLAVPYASERLLLRIVIISILVCAVAAFCSARGPFLALGQLPPDVARTIVAPYALVIFSIYTLVLWHSKMRLGETISEMRATNLALAESERSLERKVEERTAELASKNQALEKSQQQLALARDEALAANRHKSAFLANMSHELRTPLNAVIGFSEVLIDKVFGDLNEKQDEYVSDIHTSGKHLLALINDILDLSKIEAGRLELTPSTFDLPLTIENAVLLMRERARRAGVELKHEVSGDVGEMTADERQVKQILINLLTNAVKFTDEGGTVTLKADRDGDAIRIQVADTGIGISRADQEVIFEEFRQAGDERVRKQEGTGLGLALTKRLAELHGGRVGVESELGRGSTFTVSLPLSVGEAGTGTT